LEAMPALPAPRRTSAGPSAHESDTHGSDVPVPAPPQRVAPVASREAAFQSTGVIRESPQPRATPPRPSQTDENNLAEMAQRLEVALRRPTKPVDVPAASPARPVARVEPFAPPARQAAPAPSAPAAVSASGARVSQPAAPVSDLRADARVRPVPETPAPFESLEEEMASLLGRATGKT
jgi:hypothetical protein